MGEKSKFTKILGVALDILQFVFAALVVVLVSWKLTNVSITNLTNVNSNCLLDGTDSEGPISGVGFCVYAIIVGLVSIIANAIFTCIGNCANCVTLKACMANKVVGILGDTLLAVWWGLAFALFVRRGTTANELDWPERTARDGVIAAAFGGMLSFAGDVIVSIIAIARS